MTSVKKKSSVRNSIYLLTSILLMIAYFSIPINAQIVEEDDLFTTPDSVSIITDSTSTDSLASDSTKASDDFMLESKIVYDADIVSLSKTKNKIYLFGNANITYENMTLSAAKIVIDQNDNYLFAEGIIDTVDSLGNPIFKDTPVFTERGEEPMYGNNLRYDFETKRGKIVYGKTQMSPGYYKGEDIFKISKNTMLVRDGYFTSCEYIDNPHFYFRSDKMRVMVKDKIVAKPVYFYIADVPLAVIPFGVFPNKKGRRSGIIIPSYGESAYGGRFLKDIGYYWAPNDYFDATLLTDYYDKLGFVYDADLSYNLRYSLSGRISGRYYPTDPNTGANRERWGINFSHRQTIDPTTKLTASGKFQSDKTYETDNNSSFASRTNQVITSNLTLSKRFKGTKNSMTLNLSRTENLQNGNINYTFPQLSFSRSQTSIYETFFGKSGTGKRAWYQEIYFSYNSRAIRKGSRILQTADSTYKETIKQGANHNLRFNSPQKIFGYFNITPSVSYKETWADETTTAYLDESTNTIVTSQKKGFAARRTFNTSMSLKTTIYGMFEPNIGSLKFIRHKMDPSISYTYTPDFSSPFYGYYNTIIDTTGKEHKIDKFSNSPFGGTPKNESQNLSYSISNLFQAKLIDEDLNESKMDLFNLNFSGNYDFKKDSLNWGDLRTSFRANPGKRVSISLSSSHSFYKAGRNGTGTRNVFLLDKGMLPRLKTLNGTLSFSLSDKDFTAKDKDKKGESKDSDTEFENVDESFEDDMNIESDEENLMGLNTDLENTLSSLEKGRSDVLIPWKVNVNLNYSYNRSNIFNPIERIDLGVNSSIDLTQNWKIRWNLRFDWENKEISYQNFSITRDLHCWVMTFNWQPSFGFYRFQINVKESVLQDIKVTKQPAGRAFR